MKYTYLSSIILTELIPSTTALFFNSTLLFSPIPSKLPVERQIKSTFQPSVTKDLMLGVKNMHSSSGWATTRRTEEDVIYFVFPLCLVSPEVFSRGKMMKSQGEFRKPNKPLWKTNEFFIYYFIITFVTILTVKECFHISSKIHPIYSKYSHLLSDGWFFNFKIVTHFKRSL